jgi:2-C-methyl-D-erythritol 4-phosphate cytidylyltransferase
VPVQRIEPASARRPSSRLRAQVPTSGPLARPGTGALYAHAKYGLIVAAGKGHRFGGYKQLAPLAGRPVLMYSVRAFEQYPRALGFVVVAPARRLRLVRRVLRSHGVRKLLGVVPGGETRTDSVRAGLALLPENGYVAIHDAARPVITTRMLDRGFAACRNHEAVTFGHPVTDTLKSVQGNTITKTVDRESLIAVQTPQFFRLAVLRRAYAKAGGSGIEASDDCAMVETLGIKPHWLLGPRTNLKVTTREDLTLCEALL